jgi:hypothetical protein
MCSPRLDFMTFSSQLIDRLRVSLHHDADVARLDLGILARHQVDLGPRPLEPQRPAGDSGGDGYRPEAQNPVKPDASLKLRGRYFPGHVLNHQVLSDAWREAGAMFAGFDSRNLRESCAKRRAADRPTGENGRPAGHLTEAPSAGRVSVENSYHLEGGST